MRVQRFPRERFVVPVHVHWTSDPARVLPPRARWRSWRVRYDVAVGLFDEVYRRSLEQPEAFWAEAAAAIDWIEPWERVLDDSRAPFYRWFAGGRMNTCTTRSTATSRRGRADQPALIYDSPVTGTKAVFTYRELRDAVARFAGALAALGVGQRRPRDRLHADGARRRSIAMLACARHRRRPLGRLRRLRGARARDAGSRTRKPKVVVVRLVRDRAGAGRPVQAAARRGDRDRRVEAERCIVLQRPMLEAELDPDATSSGRTRSRGAEPRRLRPVEATDPLYILYTSGTTGQPKGIVRDNGGHAVALAWSMKHIYGVEPGEVYWAASDIGWAVGHSTSSTPRCCTAARPSSTRASRSARPTRARSGASSPSTASARSSPRRRRSARSASRIPDGELIGRLRPLEASARSSSPASAATRRRCGGRSRSSACP